MLCKFTTSVSGNQKWKNERACLRRCAAFIILSARSGALAVSMDFSQGKRILTAFFNRAMPILLSCGRFEPVSRERAGGG
jgi:hypothetical protein